VVRVRRIPFDAISSAKSIRPSLNYQLLVWIFYQLLVWILSVIYGGFLAGLPLDIFKDRANYLIYAEHSWEIFERTWEEGLLVGLVNEPLWLLLNAGLGAVLPPEAVLRTLIFVPATLVAWFVLRHEPRQFMWLLLFLLVPQVVKNHIIHLRQGTAISRIALFHAVFLAGWFASRQPLRGMLLVVAPFIHSSFFFVLFLLASVRIMRSLRLAADLRTLLMVGTAVGLGSTSWLAESLGARQAKESLGARQAKLYTAPAEDFSGLGFAFWMLVLIVMVLQGREFLKQCAFEINTIIFYLCTYFFSPFSARIFENTVLLVLLSGLRLTGWRNLAFLGLFLFYLLLQWFIRIGQPSFGWE